MNLSMAVSIPAESGLKNKLNSLLQLLHFLCKLDTSSAELLLEHLSACFYVVKVFLLVD
jgi:hypothetical protein